MPAILGIKDFAADHRAEKSRRFCTWAVAAKQKAAQTVWVAWKAKADQVAAAGGAAGIAAAAAAAAAASSAAACAAMWSAYARASASASAAIAA